MTVPGVRLVCLAAATLLAAASLGVLRVSRAAEVRERMIAIGLEPAEGDSATFAASVRRDYDNFGRAARQIGLKLD